LSEKIIPVDLGMVKTFAIVGLRTVLVDTGMPEQQGALWEKLLQAGIRPEDLALVVITHAHLDHFGNARFLQKKTGAKVLVHRLDAQGLRDGRLEFPNSFNLIGAVFSAFIRFTFFLKSLLRKGEGSNFGVEPDIVIDGEYDLHEYGIAGKIIHTPGHTPGSVTVLLDSGEAFVGDLVGTFLKPGKPTIPLWGNNLRELRRSIRKLMGARPTWIHASHVARFSLQDLENAFGS